MEERLKKQVKMDLMSTVNFVQVTTNTGKGELYKNLNCLKLHVFGFYFLIHLYYILIIK